MCDADQKLDLEQIPDEKKVVVQKDGKHIKSFMFKTVFQATIIYKGKNEAGKTIKNSRV